MTRKQKQSKIDQHLAYIEEMRNAVALTRNSIEYSERLLADYCARVELSKRELYRLGWKG